LWEQITNTKQEESQGTCRKRGEGKKSPISKRDWNKQKGGCKETANEGAMLSVRVEGAKAEVIQPKAEAAIAAAQGVSLC